MYDTVSTRCYKSMECEVALRQSRHGLPIGCCTFETTPSVSTAAKWISVTSGLGGHNTWGTSPRTYCEHIMTIASFFINQVSGLGGLRGAGSRIESLEITCLVWTAQSLSYNADQSQQCSLNGIITTLEGLPTV